MSQIIQPTKAVLSSCKIGDVYHVDVSGVNFHVKELRIYEDICKFYFTGQLVIETMQNSFETFLAPLSVVELTFEAPRTDGGKTKTYTEKFKIFSYESSPIGEGVAVRMQHTIQMVGEEYYKDRHSAVTKGYPNVTGSTAVSDIHNRFIKSNGGLKSFFTSLGLIGSKEVPHQALNLKPVKAIHDILDRVVYAQEKTGAPVYFRNKNGYVTGPLKTLLEKAPITERFVHNPAQGTSLAETFAGYNNVIDMRPMSPPLDPSAAAKLNSVVSSSQFFDNKTGNSNVVQNILSNIIKNPMVAKNGDMRKRIEAMLNTISKGGSIGGRNLFGIINDFMQARSVAKAGPGKYKQQEELFLALLSYTQKYWISVPLQSGVNVTCGDRITVAYPMGEKMLSKTLFIPRLIHELKFSEGDNRKPVAEIGKTDMYCVFWEG